MNIKLLQINDPHVSHTPPLGRTSDYEDQIMDKLWDCWTIAERYKVDAAVLTGDLFHKWRGLVPYSLTNRLADWLDQRPCEIIATPGNHDMNSGGRERLNEMPFGLLASSSYFTMVYKGLPTVVSARGGEVAFIGRPWEPYIDTMTNAFDLTGDEIAMAKRMPTVLVTHASILPPGDTRPYPHHNIDTLGIHKYIDLVLCGHIHEDLGVHQLDTGLWYANLGSVGRVSRTQDNMTRMPKVLIVTVHDDGMEFEEFLLPSAKPAEEVFFEKEANVVKELREFSDALADGLEMEETPIEELIVKYTKGESDEVVVRLREYLTGVTE